jgi:hypothetical protein
MKSCLFALTALALLGSSVCATARNLPDVKIVLACSKTNLPQMADVNHAIEVSDYWAPTDVRRQMVTLAREACASRPTAVLAFVPPHGGESLAAPLATK